MSNYMVECKKEGDKTPSIVVYCNARDAHEAKQYARDKACNNAYEWKLRAKKIND